MKRSRRTTSKRLAAQTAVLVVTAFLLLIVLVLLLDRPPAPVFEPDMTAPVHIITMVPEPTTEPEPARYPVPLDDNLQDWIITQCGDDIDPALVLAVIAVETAGTWNPEAVGDNGNSIGLMQIYKRYHEARIEKLGVFDLTDPYQNTAVGIDILKELSAGGKDEAWLLMAYNGGAAYADGRWEMADISRYAKKVMMLEEIYHDSLA